MRSPAEATDGLWTGFGPLSTRRLPAAENRRGEGGNLPLRYRAYLHEGAIKQTPRRRVTDQFDDAARTPGSSASTFRRRAPQLDPHQCADAGMADPARPRLSATSCVRSLDQGKIIVDPTRFVADPDKAKRFPELPYVTLRLGYVACDYFNADIGLATVRAEHQAFYRRVFLHETIAEPRMFPGLLKPVGLMAADFPRVRERIFQRYPISARPPSSGGCCSSAQADRRPKMSPIARATSLVPES